jgi:hypothetical protein
MGTKKEEKDQEKQDKDKVRTALDHHLPMYTDNTKKTLT